MAHHITHRCTSDTPNLNPPSKSMDPTIKNHPPTTTTTTAASRPTTKNPDPKTTSMKFYMANHFSRLNLNPKTQKPQKPQTPSTQNQPERRQKQNNQVTISKDVHLQAKAMNVSADLVSSRSALVKSTYYPQPPQPHRTKGGKIGRASKKDLTADLQKKPLKGLEEKQEVVVGLKKEEELAMVVVKDLDNDVKRDSISLGLGRRRRSLNGSQVELADVLASCGVKIVSVDMPPFMQIHAVDCARKTCDSLEKFGSRALALTLKKEFDGVYGPAWHCIVGTNFGSFVTHSVGGFMYFCMDQKIYILLFKTTVQRAD